MRVAFVGAVGGAGTTRLSLESAAVLARDGRSAAVIDASFATQGMADHLRPPGRISPDVTELLTGEASLEAGLIDVPLDPDDSDDSDDSDDRPDATGAADTAPGGARLAVCPARAPFERLARAKTVDAARRLETLAAEAADAFDHVLFDVPPVAANQSVAAVTAADVVAVVVPPTARGGAALARTRDRLTDIGAPADATVANFDGDGEDGIDADASVPTSAVGAPADCPVAGVERGPFPAAVAGVVEALFDVGIEVTLDDGGLL
jgi:cellulose biosynthesis protein BcsQ